MQQVILIGLSDLYFDKDLFRVCCPAGLETCRGLSDLIVIGLSDMVLVKGDLFETLLPGFCQGICFRRVGQGRLFVVFAFLPCDLKGHPAVFGPCAAADFLGRPDCRCAFGFFVFLICNDDLAGSICFDA